MSGTLHIFRRNVANGPTLYQLNFTEDSRTYAKVLENEAQLNEFLESGLAIGPDVIDRIWADMSTGSATIEHVSLSYNEANAHGMIEVPSDF